MLQRLAVLIQRIEHDGPAVVLNGTHIGIPRLVEEFLQRLEIEELAYDELVAALLELCPVRRQTDEVTIKIEDMVLDGEFRQLGQTVEDGISSELHPLCQADREGFRILRPGPAAGIHDPAPCPLS